MHRDQVSSWVWNIGKLVLFGLLLLWLITKPGAARTASDYFSLDGVDYKIESKSLYEQKDGDWIFVQDLSTDFPYGAGVVYTNTNNGSIVPARIHFADDFEDGSDFLGLFEGERWDSFVLQSQYAPTVPSYAALRNDILAGGDFIDNRIDVVDGYLRFHAFPYSGVSKSSISVENLAFMEGHTLHFSAWYRFELGMPSSIADFESRWFTGSPGPRLFIRGGYLTYELKGLTKPVLVQQEVPVIVDEWVHIRVRLLLSSTQGNVIVWQDGVRILDGEVPTLPTRDTILNSMQIGITAAREESIVLVDEVQISNWPLDQ